MRDHRVSVAAFFIVVTLVSCSHFRDTSALRFDKQEDVGSVHVAMQSVAPFEGYINSLQPQFAFNTDQAIAAAIQQTQTEDSQLFRALIASLNLSLSQNTESKTTTLKEDTTTSTTGTTTKAPGDLSKVTPPAVAPANALGALTLPSNTVGIDQSLKFRAAAALLQEVALLNNYVRDAAIHRGARPYVVRLLVTLMPNAHLEPYDAYSTISFFETPGGDFLQTKGVDAWTRGEEDGRQEVRDALVAARTRTCTDPVEVIPLLVTDNLESSLHSDTVQRIRDMAAALQGFVSNAAVGASARSRAEDASKTLNQNLNSLFTLALISPNSVQARLGAVYANNHFVMVPRTYNVTVILLVPTATRHGIGTEILPCSNINFTSLTQMRDAERGTLVPSRLAEALEPQFQLLASNWNLDSAPRSLPLYYDLANDAGRGDYAGFQQRLKTIPAARGLTSWAATPGGATSIWNDFVALAAMTGRSGGIIQIPLNEPKFFEDDSYGTLIDDGKSTELVLKGATNILADRMSGLLKFDRDGKTIYLNNTDVSVGLDGRSATLKFPSLHKLAKNGEPGKIFISVRAEQGSREWQTSTYTNVWYPMHPQRQDEKDDLFTHPMGERFREDPINYIFAGPADPDTTDPGYTLTIPSRPIHRGDDGSGLLAIEFRSKKHDKPQEVHFTVSGGFIGAIEPAVQRQGADFVVSSDGAYVLTLKSLVAGTKLTIHSFRLEGEQPIAVDNQVEVAAK